MNCFDLPYIGYRGCDIEGSSGRYLDSLPGISLGRASKIVDEKDVTGAAMMKRLDEEAIRQVVLDVQGAFTSVKWSSVIATDVYGEFSNNLVPATSWSWGVNVSKCYDDELSYPYVSALWLWPCTDTKVRVHWVCGSKEQYKDFRLIGGKPNKVNVDIPGEVDIYIIPCDTELKGVSTCGCQKECSCTCMDDRACFVIRPFIKDRDGNCHKARYFPFKIEVSCRCSLWDLVCRYKEYFTDVILFKKAILFAQESRLSTRVNPIAMDREMAADLLLEYEGGTDPQTGFKKKGKYWRALESVMKSLEDSMSSIDSNCIGCGGYKMLNVIP